jgi:hypothetical protein
MNRPPLIISFAILAAVGAGCSTDSSERQQLLASSLHEIVPHNNRDHLVYLVERPTEQGAFKPSSLQVEHVTKLDVAGEFEVTLSEDGMKTGRAHIRDDGKTLWLVSEDDYTRGVSMSYDPPLPYLSVPLFTGAVHSTAQVTLRRLADGQSAGRMQVTQVTQASAAPAGRWLTGSYAGGIELRTERTLQGPEGPFQLTSTMVLVPGIGEVKSEGIVNGTPATRRALACAIIANRSIGDCSTLMDQWKK